MVNADHIRERAEDIHAAEEAVAAALDRLAHAEVAVVDRAMDFYRASGAGCDPAARALQQACHGYELADTAHDQAKFDRDRVSGERS